MTETLLHPPAAVHEPGGRPASAAAPWLGRSERASPLATRRSPVSTYRLQLHGGFSFQEARTIVPYLKALGATDCYCSPYFQARPGSTHGYDICDHNLLNTELGSDSDYEDFVQELAANEMGQILDFVPNHMAVDPATNHWWRDVLENGPASPFARYFDIDWDPVKPELKGKVLLPVLGDHYGLVLERGELKLRLEDGTLALRYGEHSYPIDPKTLPVVLRANFESLQAELTADDPALLEFLSILTALDHLPARLVTIPERIDERRREKKLTRERLARLADAAPRIREHIERNVREFTGRPEDPRGYDRLHELLEMQAYRLASWKTAFDEINYRRFFDITELAGLRMEEPETFEATHRTILRLMHEGKVTGLRLDHLDGLYDPAEYLRLLHDAAREASGQSSVYIVVEKILSANENLREDWPVAGTTGYDFLNEVNRLFIDPQNARAMQRAYERFTGLRYSFADVVYESKKLIMRTALASELNVLAFALNRISEADRRTRDFTLNSLRAALREVVACFPVYRTYVAAAGASAIDRQMIDRAIRDAERRNPASESSIFEFIRSVLLPAEDEQQRLHFAMKFQQYTGPVQAKGIEDTAFYRHNLLVSLNEVGGDPRRFGAPVTEFHDRNLRRRDHWPHALLATATHDTKRGEDARARLNVLSEMPEEWRRQIFRWSRINAGQRTTVDGEPAPDRNDEYLYYQALLGSWPASSSERVGEWETASAPTLPLSHSLMPAPEFVQRLRDYMLKAVKEAKIHTSWINPNEAYDRAVLRFVEQTLTGPKAAKFLTAFLPFQQLVARLGMVNSLALLILKLISPGVPDFYQGTELWDLSLVDPDNRRPVDFTHRQRLLHDLEPLLRIVDCRLPIADSPQSSIGSLQSAIAEMLNHWEDGRIKLYLTIRGLSLRREAADLFLTGDYLPLDALGESVDHVVAAARRLGNHCVIGVVPRLVQGLQRRDRAGQPEQFLPIGPACWGETKLVVPADVDAVSFVNVLTGERIEAGANHGKAVLPLREILRICPVALLIKSP